ncbi:MAG: PIN domain-containing protein [Thermoplasmata archaeon]
MASRDSSFLLDLLAGDPRAVAKAGEMYARGEPRWLTPPAAAEVLVGAFYRGGSYLARTPALVDSLPRRPFDLLACRRRLGAERIRRGTPLGQADLFIAAIARRHGERLLARDRGFLRVPGLAVESY